MAVLKEKRKSGPTFPNAVEIIRIKYDFSKDTGAVAAYEVLEADSACVVKLRAAIVKAAVTSSGSLTMDLGKGASGSQMLSNKAPADLVLNAVIEGAAPVYLAAGEKVQMNIEAAAATAGIVEFVFEVLKY